MHVVVDAFVLSAVAAILGLVLAVWGTAAIAVQMVGEKLPASWEFSVGADSVVLAVVCVIASTLLAGLVPALKVARSDLNGVLKCEGRSSSGSLMGRGARWMLGTQVAVSGALILASVTMYGNLDARLNADLGVDLDRVLEVEMRTGGLAGYESREDVLGFHDRLKAKLEAELGVERVAFSGFGGGLNPRSRRVLVEGEEFAKQSQWPRAQVLHVSGDAFEVWDLELLQGRMFGDRDTSESLPVCIVSSDFARKRWEGENPVGRRLRLRPNGDWLTVVGVAPAVMKLEGIHVRGGGGGVVYTCYRQQGLRTLSDRTSLLVRGVGQVAQEIDLVERLALEMEPALALPELENLATRREELFAMDALVAKVLSTLGAAVLLMAFSGMYVLMQFTVRERSLEFGLRRALGGARLSILGSAFRHMVGVVAGGILIGVLLGYPLSFWVIGGISSTAFVADFAFSLGVLGAVVAISLLLTASSVWARVCGEPSGLLRV